ncbi:hypothetical protein GCM10009557_49560 [Virgisporangium ochraceum]
MSRALFESFPDTAEVLQRLRRIEDRVGRIEAALPRPAAPPAAKPAPPRPAGTRRWVELGARLDALALKLKLHYEQAGGDGMPRALDDLRDSVREAFTAAGNAIEDDAIRGYVHEVGVMVADAVADGLSTVGTDLRHAVRRQ